MYGNRITIVRIYLPPDANCLLSTMDHCLKSKNYVNAIVASKHPRPQWLTMEQAVKHCTQGIGIWDWASSDNGDDPDVVLACCGDTPTLEALAAVDIMHKEMPDVKVRFVNVVDLMRLEPKDRHPHGLSDVDYDTIFTKDKPIIFAFHGYPTLIHELTYTRHNHNIHVHGYHEEGTGNRGAFLVQKMKDKLVEHKTYIHDVGIDMPEVAEWKWTGLN